MNLSHALLDHQITDLARWGRFATELYRALLGVKFLEQAPSHLPRHAMAHVTTPTECQGIAWNPKLLQIELVCPTRIVYITASQAREDFYNDCWVTRWVTAIRKEKNLLDPELADQPVTFRTNPWHPSDPATDGP